MKVNKIVNSTIECELEITGATLLSIEEAEEYLTRVERAYDCWWWLCSPSNDSYYAKLVDYDGVINYRGRSVGSSNGCVRPALQIKNLESSNLKIGDFFELGGFEFKVISENLAWMHKQDIGRCAFNKDLENGNNYETSDVKKFVDEWFKALINFKSEEIDDILKKWDEEGW